MHLSGFSCSISAFITLYFSLLCTQVAHGVIADSSQWIEYNGPDGVIYLEDDREPALYTGNYGECQDDSVIDVTHFDAAYYKDNMTIAFHLAGSTAVANESVMLNIGVYAYGESRFSLTFDPCSANIRSMCPINASVPIEASYYIPLGPSDVAGIPSIALSIPDFEGQAILRVFANSTQSQIACYSAVMKNGHSMSHPAAVGTTVGVFVIIALISSTVTAIYGTNIAETRKHYAHSLSMFVIFSILQHVFLTGALSVNFPSILVAWWSNFGWASGMIYSNAVEDSIDNFIGTKRGNIGQLGSAQTGQTAVNLGGGFSASLIYKRAVDFLTKRAVLDKSSGFTWYGNAVPDGLPLPGNYSGFPGTLGQLQIPGSNAFLTGLIWLLILIVIIASVAILLKFVLELLASTKLLKSDHLRFFRTHWIYCVGIVVLRICFIAFFMMMFLTLFQFTLGGSSGALAIASIIFLLLLFGVVGLAGCAIYSRLNEIRFINKSDRAILKIRKAGKHSWFRWPGKLGQKEQNDPERTITSFQSRNNHLSEIALRQAPNEDEEFLIRYGWLSARFRQSKWWFFAYWLAYEFVRACFYGGAAGHPLTQVFGLLVWEIVNFCIIVVLRPFESNRLNMLMVYALGFSKVVSVALCSAFDPRFGVGRILTTVIGVIVIVIQGILIILMLIAIVVGAITSWMSICRYKEGFYPKRWTGYRTRYFAHIDQKTTDQPKRKPEKIELQTIINKPKEPYFSVTTVRREAKIEDGDPDDLDEPSYNVEDDIAPAGLGEWNAARSRSRQSMRAPSEMSRSSTSNLPYGAKRHRTSWSTHDFQDTDVIDNPQSGRASRLSMESLHSPIATPYRSQTPSGIGTLTPKRRRTGSNRQSWINDPSLVEVANAHLPGSSTEEASPYPAPNLASGSRTDTSVHRDSKTRA